MNHSEVTINKVTKLNQNHDENITWSKIIKKEKKALIRRGYGEPPLAMGEYETTFVPLNSNKKYQKMGKTNKENFKRKGNSKHLHSGEHSRNQSISDESLHSNFSTIAASVREVTGGYNTQSNAALEKYYKEQQEQNESLNSSFNTATSSSQTTCSYKTAEEDPANISGTFDDQDTKSENSFDGKYNRYKRNALVTGVLRDITYNSSDIESPNEPSVLDASESQFEIEKGINNMNLNEAEQESERMHKYRLNRFFQSEEDPDVYYHGLKEQLPKDPEWRQYRLKRKGIETTKTPRQYFFGLEDDDFGFVKRK